MSPLHSLLEEISVGAADDGNSGHAGQGEGATAGVMVTKGGRGQDEWVECEQGEETAGRMSGRVKRYRQGRESGQRRELPLGCDDRVGGSGDGGEEATRGSRELRDRGKEEANVRGWRVGDSSARKVDGGKGNERGLSGPVLAPGGMRAARRRVGNDRAAFGTKGYENGEAEERNNDAR
ncbi:hypothetical protein EDB92DRAFT_1819460 [Lactarius akahatsu]|uniref:Uncharacterized protein n=1 Tax=Lactarius akahatsu TaxID=416441 RepID=A0AAD4LAB4_9AGAM|nr:hypothetical protein EDB92DRAFT_1819460 [Lactarius akahatsu]